MTSTAYPDITRTIYQGRAAIAAHPALADALKDLLETVANVPQPDRTLFLEYVRLVYGTTASITAPTAEAAEDALARFRAAKGDHRLVILDDVDHDDRTAVVDAGIAHGRALALELASDRPDRG